MDIQGSTHVHGPHALRGPHTPPAAKPPSSQPTSPASGDQLEISAAAEAAIQAEEHGEIRHDIVARLKREIQQGTYETPEKLDQALDRLLDELA